MHSFTDDGKIIPPRPPTPKSAKDHTCTVNFDTLNVSSPEAFIRAIDRECEACGDIARHRESMNPGVLDRAFGPDQMSRTPHEFARKLADLEARQEASDAQIDEFARKLADLEARQEASDAQIDGETPRREASTSPETPDAKPSKPPKK